jgi:hypothetical protein
MVLRPFHFVALLLTLLAVLAAVALLMPRHGERLVARAASKVPAATLRDCLGTKLGLTWQGDPRAMHASALGLRAVVGDNGQSRQVGLFTDGGRPLTSSESAALQDCLGAQ